MGSNCGKPSSVTNPIDETILPKVQIISDDVLKKFSSLYLAEFRHRAIEAIKKPYYADQERRKQLALLTASLTGKQVSSNVDLQSSRSRAMARLAMIRAASNTSSVSVERAAAIDSNPIDDDAVPNEELIEDIMNRSFKAAYVETCYAYKHQPHIIDFKVPNFEEKALLVLVRKEVEKVLIPDIRNKVNKTDKRLQSMTMELGHLKINQKLRGSVHAGWEALQQHTPLLLESVRTDVKEILPRVYEAEVGSKKQVGDVVGKPIQGILGIVCEVSMTLARSWLSQLRLIRDGWLMAVLDMRSVLVDGADNRDGGLTDASLQEANVVLSGHIENLMSGIVTAGQNRQDRFRQLQVTFSSLNGYAEISKPLLDLYVPLELLPLTILESLGRVDAFIEFLREISDAARQLQSEIDRDVDMVGIGSRSGGGDVELASHKEKMSQALSLFFSDIDGQLRAADTQLRETLFAVRGAVSNSNLKVSVNVSNPANAAAMVTDENLREGQAIPEDICQLVRHLLWEIKSFYHSSILHFRDRFFARLTIASQNEWRLMPEGVVAENTGPDAIDDPSTLVYRELQAACISAFDDSQESFSVRFLASIKGIIIAALLPTIGEQIKESAKNALQLLRSDLPEKLQAYCDLDKLIPQYISEQMEPRLHASLMDICNEVGDAESAAASAKLLNPTQEPTSVGKESGALTILGAMSSQRDLKKISD